SSLAQSTFIDGSIHGTNCTTSPCWPGVRGSEAVDPSAPSIALHDNFNSPWGDSIQVSILSAYRTKGMGINWLHGFDKAVGAAPTIAHPNASHNFSADVPRVIYRLFDPMTRAWSPWDSTELDADDVSITPTETLVVHNAYRIDWPPRDKAGLNLPGG